MVQVPGEMIVTVPLVPDAVQTPGVAEAKLTVRVDVAVALTVTVCVPEPSNVCVTGAVPKVLDWASAFTVKFWEAIVAAA
jgi:hypothetical protein